MQSADILSNLKGVVTSLLLIVMRGVIWYAPSVQGGGGQDAEEKIVFKCVEISMSAAFTLLTYSTCTKNTSALVSRLRYTSARVVF